MANPSTSTSTSTNDYVFDVFMNYRGLDVQETLATALYHRLTKHDLRVFFEKQELQAGVNMIPQIKSVIRTASVHIAIFSPHYADSPWCLNELVLMLESKSSSTIIPVFYGVSPTEVRYNRGHYARSLCVLEKKTSDGGPKYDSGIIEKWRNTLSEVAKIEGFFYSDKYYGDQQILERVVEKVLKFVKRPLDVAKYPIGLKEKIEDFLTTVPLQLESGKVRVVGIVGLGGVGKTTLAKEIFNYERSNYKRSCFLFDIRQKSLTRLQIGLLNDLTHSDEQIHSVDEGIRKLRRYPSFTNALIILDDVDHIQQLDALLFPLQDVLNTGSLILVTSRYKDILARAGIPKSSIYSLTGLSPQHSRELFCRYAFNQPAPPEGFDKVVENFLGACQGLPLSITVLGALLRGKNDLNYWEAQFRKSCIILPKDIQSKLKISYDRLDEEEKQMFIDIACFFTEEDKDTVIRIWDGSHWEGSLGLQNLENNCLVEVDDQNRVTMHNHLKALGRTLAEKKLPGCMLRFSRPSNEVDDLSGLSPVRGISMVHGNDPEQCFKNLEELAGSSLPSSMKSLQLLRAEGCFVESLLSFGPLQELLYLRWDNCTNYSLASSIPMMRNLRVLYIQGVNLKTLWDRESEALVQLRELYIDAPLEDVPTSIGKLRHLEKFVLCQSYLETLPDELCHINSLKHLDLKYCEKLRLLPDSIGNLASLEILGLGGCSNLQALPDSVGKLTSLRSLDLGWCSNLQALPDSVGKSTSLRSLDLGWCSTLQTLPYSVGILTSLQSINLYMCSSLQTLPESVSNLTALRSLDLGGCSTLKTLPDWLRNMTGLRSLNLGGCSTLPTWVGKLTGLESLDLDGSSTLQTLPDWIGNLSGLRSLDMGGCSMLQTLPDRFEEMTGLQSLNLNGCSNLQTLPDSIGNLTGLKDLDLSLCSTLQKLPDTVRNLTSLRYFYFERVFQFTRAAQWQLFVVAGKS